MMVPSVFRNRRDNSKSPPTRSPFSLSSSSTRLPLGGVEEASAAAVTEYKYAEPALEALNAELLAIAEIFPNVRPEVFREMLSEFSEQSRLHVIAETLLKYEARWVRGRWRVSPRGTSSKILKEVFEVEKITEEAEIEKELVPVEETFRSKQYKRTVKLMLSSEFKTLSRSTIDGVLAEHNFSYSLSRPILLGLASKSWRINFSALLSRWKRSNQSPSDSHYMLVWTKASSSGFLSIPQLRQTGSIELDDELYSSILKPLLDQRQERQQLISLELATLLNEQEAESAGAAHECEVCFSDVTFEAMATCTEGTHTICFTCIQRSVSEALYGQSWGLNIDHVRSQVACVAPSDRPCAGCIPNELTDRALLQMRGGSKTLAKLQARFAFESLQNSGAKYVGCQYCAYAELDDIFLPPGTVQYRLNNTHPFLTFLLLLLGLLFVVPFLAQYFFVSSISFLSLPRPATLFSNSLRSLVRRTHLPSRFQCQSPDCLRASCRVCKAAWRDPHTCYESAALSLRTTVEAARTAALKRTCPRCGLAFVKESGCNKMVCICGYSMCYICRQGLGPKTVAPAELPPAQRPRQRLGLLRFGGAEDEDDNAAVAGDDAGHNAGEPDGGEGEGYRHFCQHFRPTGGRCTECEKCDLYRGEDEDEIVRRAGQRAESDWRKRQATKVMAKSRNAGGDEHYEEPGENSGWLQELLDWWLGMVLKC